MSGQSHLTRTLIAAFGALLMSTVAVGAASNARSFGVPLMVSSSTPPAIIWSCVM